MKREKNTKNSNDKSNKNEVNNMQDKNFEKASKNKKVKKHKGLKRFFLIVLLIILILAGYFVYQVNKNGGGLVGIVTTVVGGSSESTDNLEDIYFLAMGKSQNMTDTIMVIKYSPKNQQASMLSIPRDTFVGTNQDKATAWDKINSKYQLSPQTTIDEVNELTGLNIKYYITVDTKALRDLVDALGGIDFDVPMNMDYDDCTQDLAIHLTAGYQHLDGAQAEGLVRFRHNNNGTSYSTSYGDNDLGRMKTQREFIKVVLQQTMKAGNITKINQLMKIAQEEVDTNIEWDTVKNYIPALMKFNQENLKSDMLPGVAQYCNGVAVYLANPTKSKEMVKELFLTVEDSTENTDETNDNTTNTAKVNTTKTTTATGKSSSEVKIEVLNGTGNSSKLNTAINQLKNQGYKVTKSGTTNVVNKTTIIDRKNNTKEVENAIKSLLGAGTTTVGEDNSNVDFTVIIGKDY